MRPVEYLDPVGHLVVLLGVVVVVHAHPEDLADFGQGLAVDRLRTHPVPSIASWVAGSVSTANTVSAGASTVVETLTFSLLMSVQTAGTVGTHR